MLTNLNAFHPMNQMLRPAQTQVMPNTQFAPQTAPSMTPVSTPGTAQPMASGPNTQFQLNPGAQPLNQAAQAPAAPQQNQPFPPAMMGQNWAQLSAPGQPGQGAPQAPFAPQGPPNWSNTLPQMPQFPTFPTLGGPQPMNHPFTPPTLANPLQPALSRLQVLNRFRPPTGVLGN